MTRTADQEDSRIPHARVQLPAAPGHPEPAARLDFLRALHLAASEGPGTPGLLADFASRLSALMQAPRVALLVEGDPARYSLFLMGCSDGEKPRTVAGDDPLLQLAVAPAGLVVQRWESLPAARDSILRDWATGEVMAWPLAIAGPSGHRRGLLLAAPGRSPEARERELWQEVAGDIGVALGAHLSRSPASPLDDMRRQISQLGTALSSALNLNALLRLVVSSAMRLTGAEAGVLSLVENGVLRPRVELGGIGDAPSDVVEIPLVVRERAKGRLALRLPPGAALRSDVMSLLDAFSAQAATAIENAEGFEVERQQAREATLLYRAARSIALCKDYGQVLDSSIAQLLKVTSASRCLLFLAGDRHLEYRLEASAGLSEDQRDFFSVCTLKATPSSREVWEALLHGRPVHLGTAPAGCPSLAHLFALLPATSGLLVPLMAKEQMLGLLFLDDPAKPRTFDPEETRMVMTLSILVATAIQRARLVAQLEENVEQFQALRRVATAITGTLSLSKVLSLLVDQAARLLGNAPCALLVEAPGGEGLQLHECRGFSDLLADPAIQGQIAARATARKRPASLYVGDGCAAHEREEPGEASNDGEAGIESWLQAAGLGGVLALPLVARRRIVGVLNCFTRPGHRFHASQVQLLKGFANQAAAALENARLHGVVKNKMHELASLFEVGKAITSTLQLDRVLQGIADQVLRVSRADACAILLMDGMGKSLSLRTSRGLGDTGSLQKVRLGAGTAGLAARTGRPMVATDDTDGEFPDSLRAQGFRTALSLPLSARGRVVGLVNLYHRTLRQPEAPELNLLTTLSAQAAIAIDNARLYQEKNQVSQLLRKLLLPVQRFDHPGFAVGHCFIPSSELSGDCYDMIALTPHRAAFCMADVSGKGPRAAMYAVRARYILRSYVLAGYSPREVLTMMNQLITPEAESDMFITLFCAEVDQERHRTVFSSAGHEPPLLWRATSKKSQPLPPRDIVVGIERTWQYIEERAHMTPGDVLVLYTDGVTEARGTHVEAFGTARLQALVDKHAALAPQRLADLITATVLKHTGRRLNDDFSLMVVKMTP